MFEFLASIVNKVAVALSAAIIAIVGLASPAVQDVMLAHNLNPVQSEISTIEMGEAEQLKVELEALREEIAELKNGKQQTAAATQPPKTTVAPPTAPSKQPAHSPIEVSFINPTIVINSGDNIMQIHGNGFKKGLTVSTGDSYLELAMNFDPNPQPNLIFVKIPAGMNPGIYNVKVKNPDGGTATLDRALTVRAGIAMQDNGFSTTEIVNRLQQEVVLIRTDTGCGSGLVIDRSEILTNNHVVRNVSSAKVILNGGQIVSAAVVARGSSSGLDLALLKPVGDYKLPFTTFSASDEQSLPVGSGVVALGFPLTCNEDFTLITEEGSVTGRREGWLQTSARIHGGNSGGPLVSKKTGQVVGINTLGAFVIDSFNLSGISFALPSDDAWAWLVDVRSR